MNSIRALGATLAVLAASLLVGCVGVSDAEDASVGEAAQAQSLFNVRSGPGFNYPIVYQVPPGTSLNIVCYTNDFSGNVWYQLGDRNYILGSLVGGGRFPACIGAGLYH